MSVVDVYHVLCCACVCRHRSVCFAVFTALLFIRRAANLSWLCLRETSVCIFDKPWHLVGVWVGEEQSVCWCVCAVIMYPVMLLPWQTPTSQLATHSSWPHCPCMPQGINTLKTYTHSQGFHTLVQLDWRVSVSSAFLFRGEKDERTWNKRC